MLHNQPQIACHECDALVNRVPLRTGQKLVCPRCGCVLQKHTGKHFTRRVTACSLTALILMPPAYLMPIMTFDMLGSDTVDTMLAGVINLFDGGYWLMGVLVLLCSIVAPLVETLLLLVIGLMAQAGQYTRRLAWLLKAQRRIKKWGMLEVYLLGILVAYIKLIEDGQIHLGVGLFCFCGVLLATTFNAVMFEAEPLWERIGAQRERQSV